MPENSPGPFQIADYFGHVVWSEDLVNIGKFVMFFRKKIRHGAFDEFEAISVIKHKSSWFTMAKKKSVHDTNMTNCEVNNYLNHYRK